MFLATATYLSMPTTAIGEDVGVLERRDAVVTELERGADALPFLRQALEDPAPPVRRTAAHALVRLGEPAKETLREALQHPDPAIRQIALEGLGREWILNEYMEEATRDDDPVVRSWTWGFLSGQPPETEAAWQQAGEALTRLLQEDDALTRAQVVRLILAWEDGEERFSSLLEQAAEDSEAGIRALAQRTLWPFPWHQPRKSVQARLPQTPIERVKQVRLPVEGWRFRIDPPGQPGHQRGWYEPEYDDAQWTETAIEQWWLDDVEEGYIGVAWFRREFELPEREYDAVELLFGGIDENGWVWVNGQYAGQHAVGPAGWEAPFRIDITDLVNPEEPNHLTVRVKNSSGAGGIHQPIHLQLYQESQD